MSDTLAAAQPPRRPEHAVDEGFGRGLKISFTVHVLAVCLAIFKSIVFPGDPKPYIPALRVDMVALPDMLKKDLQNAPKEQSQSAKEIAQALKRAEAEAKSIKPIKIPDVPKAEPAAPDEMVLNPKKAAEKQHERDVKLKGALARIKALSKIASEEKETAPPKGAIIKGNKLSKGTRLSGDAKESSVTEYYDRVHDKLLENWELPVWLSRQNYSAKALIFIDSRGRVKSLRITKSSGNGQFDSAVKKAIEESQPFPTPPEEVASSVLVDGIHLGFPL